MIYMLIIYCLNRECSKRGCLWKENTIPNGPNCYYPPDWGYRLSSIIDKPYGKQYILEEGKYTNPYGQDIKTVHMDLIYDTNERIRIRMTDPLNPNRYEAPITIYSK